VAQDKPRKNPYERRAIWVFVLAVVASVFPFGLFSLSGPEVWNVVLFIVSQAALVLAVAASGLALAPGLEFMPATLSRRTGELLFSAVGLVWLSVLLTAISVSISAVDSIGDSGF
jgi:hypothetical protein